MASVESRQIKHGKHGLVIHEKQMHSVSMEKLMNFAEPISIVPISIKHSNSNDVVNDSMDDQTSPVLHNERSTFIPTSLQHRVEMLKEYH